MQHAAGSHQSGWVKENWGLLEWPVSALTNKPLK